MGELKYLSESVNYWVGRMARYGLVKVRFVIDDDREELVVFQIYDPKANRWVGISEADGIAEGVVDKPIAGGFHLTRASHTGE